MTNKELKVIMSKIDGLNATVAEVAQIKAIVEESGAAINIYRKKEKFIILKLGLRIICYNYTITLNKRS